MCCSQTFTIQPVAVKVVCQCMLTREMVTQWAMYSCSCKNNEIQVFVMELILFIFTEALVLQTNE